MRQAPCDQHRHQQLAAPLPRDEVRPARDAADAHQLQAAAPEVAAHGGPVEPVGPPDRDPDQVRPGQAALVRHGGPAVRAQVHPGAAVAGRRAAGSGRPAPAPAEREERASATSRGTTVRRLAADPRPHVFATTPYVRNAPGVFSGPPSTCRAARIPLRTAPSMVAGHPVSVHAPASATPGTGVAVPGRREACPGAAANVARGSLTTALATSSASRARGYSGLDLGADRRRELVARHLHLAAGARDRHGQVVLAVAPVRRRGPWRSG